jgi:hypothetical protein
MFWGSGLSDFPVWGPSCPAVGRNFRNDYLLCGSLCDQNLQLVLTIPSGSASEAEPTVRTTPPKVGKADTSSAEVPMVPTLVAQPGSKALDDTAFDNDLMLLNSTMVVS